MRPKASSPGASNHEAIRTDRSFYHKAAASALACGSLASQVDGAIVHLTNLDASATGDITPLGGDVIGLQLTTQFSSSAYGFVNGVGALEFATGAASGFFRGNEIISVGPSDSFAGSSLNFAAFSAGQQNAQAGTDNYFMFRFQSGDVNGGNAVYGWGRLNADLNSPDQSRIMELAYDTSGNAITLGQVPEPSGLALLSLGAAGATVFHRRRRTESNAVS